MLLERDGRLLDLDLLLVLLRTHTKTVALVLVAVLLCASNLAHSVSSEHSSTKEWARKRREERGEIDDALFFRFFAALPAFFLTYM